VRAALHNPGYGSHRLLGSVERILSECQLCALATHEPAGKPHISTVFFCFSDDLDLYFLSDPGSTHGHNIARGPSAAIAVYDSHQIWGDAHRGLQMFGSCSLLSGAAEEEGRRLYARRFPRYLEFAAHPGEKAGLSFSGLRFFRFVTASLKILDEEEFGDGVFVLAIVERLPGDQP
jgi:nitroimidazol reductase NimA-like FMN-containing flavoprotein (pyridoxamine 5'-phosphate oxidase superfamily)